MEILSFWNWVLKTLCLTLNMTSVHFDSQKSLRRALLDSVQILQYCHSVTESTPVQTAQSESKYVYCGERENRADCDVILCDVSSVYTLYGLFFGLSKLFGWPINDLQYCM